MLLDVNKFAQFVVLRLETHILKLNFVVKSVLTNFINVLENERKISVYSVVNYMKFTNTKRKIVIFVVTIAKINTTAKE